MCPDPDSLYFIEKNEMIVGRLIGWLKHLNIYKLWRIQSLNRYIYWDGSIIDVFVLLIKALIMYIYTKKYKYSDYKVTFRYTIFVNFIICIKKLIDALKRLIWVIICQII